MITDALPQAWRRARLEPKQGNLSANPRGRVPHRAGTRQNAERAENRRAGLKKNTSELAHTVNFPNLLKSKKEKFLA